VGTEPDTERELMAKNIVLCSDGTGNKGGSGSNTNVFKIYNAVRINDLDLREERRQVVFYDNGVGTSKSKLGKVLGGAFGWGFRQNVRDLYEFLGRHYTHGDHIYIFGFSRGAATVRAFAGMLQHCGLVIKNPLDKQDKLYRKEDVLDEKPFQDRIDAAMQHYVDSGGKPSVAGFFKALGRLFKNAPKFKHEPEVEIEFMGVWDTVAALGAPQIPILDAVLNLLRRHQFYNYEPASCVKNVYHALAVDDERGTFWPLVWNEAEFTGETIEQVWFSGMHANIGGGYPRDELANVTLDWMIEKLNEHGEALRARLRASPGDTSAPAGLLLKSTAMADAKADANPHGKLHDSRGGFKIFYRYQPRPIQDRCVEKKAKIRLHTSVLDRMEMRTAGYTPGNLPEPGQLEVVFTGPENFPSSPKAEQRAEYTRVRAGLARLRKSRIMLYWTFLLSTATLVGASGFAWLCRPELSPPDCCSQSALSANETWRVMHWWLAHLEDALRYVLPTFFDNAITYLVIQHPARLLVLVVYGFALLLLRMLFQSAMETREEHARIEMLAALGR